MYKDFYQLKTEPFGTHPDPGIIFISNTHKQAWYYLLSSMDTQEPYLMLTGEYGMGKTLLCLRLIQVLSKKGKPTVEYIATPNEGYDGILRRIAISLGISETPEDVSMLQGMIYNYFRSHVENPRIYLIIDDAQEMDQSALIRLKQLSTFNHNGFFPVSIIFVAHPSFLQMLKTPALSSLNQRIKRRYHLSRFSFDDTKNYIDFRMLKSGATGISAFPEESIEKIFTCSGGVPRLINNICDTCLLMGASKRLTTIPLSVVEEAVALVEGSLAPSGPEDFPPSGARDEAGECVAIAESLQSAKDAEQESLLTALIEIEDGKSENNPHKASGFGKRLRQVAMLTVSVCLFMAAGAFISQLFLKDGDQSAVFISDKSPEKHQMIPESSMPAEVDSQTVLSAPGNVPLQPEDSRREESSRQNETNPKSPDGLLSPAPQPEVMTADTAAPSSKDMPGESEIRPKTELFPPEIAEPVLLPYSLRSSSYQQQSRAGRELADIRQLGLTPYLVRVDIGDMGVWWRVYIGFYSTEEEAKKLKAIYNLPHVTIQKTDYACQLGEFATETELSAMFDRLKASDFFPYVIQKGKDRFLLYVGAYERKIEAEFEHKNLLKKGFKNQIVKR